MVDNIISVINASLKMETGSGFRGLSTVPKIHKVTKMPEIGSFYFSALKSTLIYFRHFFLPTSHIPLPTSHFLSRLHNLPAMLQPFHCIPGVHDQRRMFEDKPVIVGGMVSGDDHAVICLKRFFGQRH